MKESDACLICHSSHRLTFHHLIPKSCHSNKWFRKNFSREEMQTRGVSLCRSCHSFLHRQFDEKTLGRELNTAQAILDNHSLQKYARWALKQQARHKVS